ncbi:MAG: enoyl-CoA hydratase/isomerase family protein [Aliiglaciecola sp.]
MNLPVVFDLLVCEGGKKVGVATLNKPEALNAIDLEMVQLLFNQLQSWQGDEDVAMVFIDSQGDKAFCAGGDVVSMHQAMFEQAGSRDKGHQTSLQSIPVPIETFFTEEYRLDFLIHTYSKPILVWGNGIIMGGGLGLMAGASHRIVTESSRIAMPEVSIGLYPDVGGTWFLNRMPAGCGLFLGMTGASVSGNDALFVGLADHLIHHDKKSEVLNQIRSIEWDHCGAQNASRLTNMCEQLSAKDITSGSVQTHQQLIAELADYKTVSDYIEALQAVDVTDDKWLGKAIASIAYGSPITMHLVFEQLQKGQGLSLAECFQMELTMSCRCATFGEFQEGVRALLIDKDRSPKWAFAQVQDVDQQTIDTFFQSPWKEGQHPLSDLGQSK